MQRETEISPFISALSKTLSLWPEDEEKHKCPSWREGHCRNLECLLKSEKEDRDVMQQDTVKIVKKTNLIVNVTKIKRRKTLFQQNCEEELCKLCSFFYSVDKV